MPELARIAVTGGAACRAGGLFSGVVDFEWTGDAMLSASWSLSVAASVSLVATLDGVDLPSIDRKAMAAEAGADPIRMGQAMAVVHDGPATQHRLSVSMRGCGTTQPRYGAGEAYVALWRTAP